MPDILTFEELRSNLMSLYEESQYAAALELVEKNELHFPEKAARTAFWKICLLSLDGRLEEALSTFRQGLQDGMWWHESQFNDTDMDPLRDLPEFQELVARSVLAWEHGRKQIERDHLLRPPEPPPSSPYPLIIVLHGRNGDKETNLEQWEIARRFGWAILSAQSTQPLYQGAYHWDDPVIGMQDISYYLEQSLEANPIDRERIIIGGFSQGGGMAIYAALSGSLPVRGFISSATWWPDIESLAAVASHAKNLRGYFICGEKDYALDRAREIQIVLQQHQIPYTEEFHPGLGHEFPADFETSFTSALEYIFKE